jgi:hypothetical protein
MHHAAFRNSKSSGGLGNSHHGLLHGNGGAGPPPESGGAQGKHLGEHRENDALASLLDMVSSFFPPSITPIMVTVWPWP